MWEMASILRSGREQCSELGVNELMVRNGKR